MIIRPERNEDNSQIYDVNLQAFNNTSEPEVVNRLRESQWYIRELSLVAEEQGVIIGHILFSKIGVRREDHSLATILTLGPVAVLPDYQRKGIGSQLIKQGLAQCAQLGYGVVVLLGHPEYYPRFGFIPARPQGFCLQFDAPDEAFMIAELIPGQLAAVGGTIEYPPEWGL